MAKAPPFKRRIYINDGVRGSRNLPSDGHTDVLQILLSSSRPVAIVYSEAPKKVPTHLNLLTKLMEC